MRLIKNVGKNTKTFNYDWWECYYLRGKTSFWNGKNTKSITFEMHYSRAVNHSPLLIRKSLFENQLKR